MEIKQIYYMNDFKVNAYKEPIDNTFTIKLNGGKFKRFLFKYVFKLLSKVADVKQYLKIYKRMEIQRVEIDYREIEKMLFEHMDSIRCIYNKECRMICIGHKQMAQMNNRHNDAFSPMSIRFPNNYYSNSVYGGERLEFAGIEVVVVPWIDGAFAIPKQ